MDQRAAVNKFQAATLLTLLPTLPHGPKPLHVIVEF
jgi:hypothetical protein